MFDNGVAENLESHESTSRTLLERVRLCDPEAWRRFVALYGPVIYGWATRAGLQSHDAADVTQEVFQAAAANIVRFRRQRPGDSLRGWLWTITRNKMLDLRRAAQLRTLGDAAAQELPDDWRTPDEPDDPPTATTCELAHRALALIQAEFETTTWQAFLRLVLDDRTAADVAAELGLSLAAVYKAKSRVLLRLRRELDGLVEGGN